MTKAEISSRALELLEKYSIHKLERHDLHLVSDKFLGSELFFGLDDQCNITNMFLHIDSTHRDDQKLALLCAALDLVMKTGVSHLFKVSFRETESYLRDQNHLPAWESVTASRKWFNEALEEIISGMVNALLMKQGASLVDWESLSLAERISESTAALDRISTVFELVLQTKLELVSIEEEEIIVTGGLILLDHKYFEVLMNRALEYLQFSLCSTKIKLVAQ